MMNVLIVSLQRTNDKCLVYALNERGFLLQLLDKNGNNLPSDTEFETRQIWKIDGKLCENERLPHDKDYKVLNRRFVTNPRSTYTMLKMITERKARIWIGEPFELFDHKLQWTNSGTGFISEEKIKPNISMGFWIPSVTLERKDYNGKVIYQYIKDLKPEFSQQPKYKYYNIEFVGNQKPMDVIPSGSLLFVSLTRWSKQEISDDNEKRYLRLLEWFD